MKCRMGLDNKAKKGTHVQMHKKCNLRKWGKRENHMGKTFPKRGKYKHARKHEGRKASTRPPKDNFRHPKHGPQLKIVW